jgi:hypothetical protein
MFKGMHEVPQPHRRTPQRDERESIAVVSRSKEIVPYTKDLKR